MSSTGLLSDAYYTARILQSMDYDKYKDRLSIDTFYSPRIKEEEIFVRLMNILNLLPVSF